MGQETFNPLGIYLFKVNNRNTRRRCKTCSKLKKDIKKASNDVVLVSLLLTSYIVLVNFVEFEQISAGWAEALRIGAFKGSCFLKERN